MHEKQGSFERDAVLILEKTMEWIVLSILVFTALLFHKNSDSLFLLPKESYFKLAVCLGTVLWMARTAFSGKLHFFRTPLNLPLLLLPVAVLITSFFAEQPVLSHRNLLNILTAGLFYFLVQDAIRSKAQVKKILYLLIWLAGLTALYGILQYYGFDLFRTYWEEDPKHIFGTFGNPNFLSQYLICILPVSFIIAFLGWRKRDGVICGLSIFFSFLALLISQTRAAWSGSLASFLFMGILFAFKDRAFLKEHKKALWLLPAGVLVVVLLFLGLNVVQDTPEETSGLVHRVKTSPRDPFREFVWTAAWQMFTGHPFTGVGPGNFKLQYPDYQAALLAAKPVSYIIPTNVNRVHNEYLQAASEMGLPGLAIACWLALALLWHGVRCFSRTGEGEGRRLLAGILAGCAALLANAFFSFPFHVSSTVPVFICLAALLAPVASAYGAPVASREIRLSFFRFPVLRWIFVIAVLAVCVFSSVRVLNRFAADIYLRKGSAMMEVDARLNTAHDLLARGVRLSPDEGRLHFALASVLHRKGDQKAAITELQRALETFRDINVYHSLGIAYMIDGQGELARQTWEEAVSIRPDAAETLVCLALDRLEKGELSAAFKWLDQAGTYDPAAMNARYMLGHVYMLQNRPLRAVTEWKQVSKLAPEEIERLHRFGRASLKQGNYYAQAREGWRKALELAPNHAKLRAMVEGF